MGYCACRRNESPPLYPVVVFLSVVAILLAIPWVVSQEPVIEVETPKVQINWALIITPLLLLAMVHWLSSAETRRPCPMPPPYYYATCPCRGKYVYSNTNPESDYYTISKLCCLYILIGIYVFRIFVANEYPVLSYLMH
ncbi:hypothetical protein G4B88_006683 [Cannabis sativa]|uniref:Uncharacterized protein n=1 Tax=Cannabis sativa TaxID=3483 RepID=A0A7J6GGG2_CANSA|nr:hypothetical protein G4B88_006683 [Cannabis sativa]